MVFLDQVVVEKKIMKEGNKTRHDLGRKQFVAEVLGYFLFIYSDHLFSLLVSIFHHGFSSVLFVAKLSIVNFTHGFKSARLTRGWWAITGVQMEGAIWRHHLQSVSSHWHVPRLVSRGIFICRMVTQHL